MKFLFFTGSRSEWGYIKPLLRLCKKYKIDYNICATNMHLLDNFGNSVKEIEKEGFKVSDKVYMALDGYNHYTMAKSMGIIISSFTDILQRVSAANPFFYIIDGFRYGFLGVADGSIRFGLFYLIVLSCLSWFAAYILFKKGYKIKF